MYNKNVTIDNRHIQDIILPIKLIVHHEVHEETRRFFQHYFVSPWDGQAHSFVVDFMC